MTDIKANWRDIGQTGGVPVPGDSQMSAAEYNLHAAQTNANTDAIAAIGEGGGSLGPGSVTLANLVSSIQATLAKADTALQSIPTNSVGSGQITDGSVALADLTSSIQTSLTHADTALQTIANNSIGSSQIADGTVALGDLTTALQNSVALANTALQSIAAGSVGSTQITDGGVALVDLVGSVQTSLSLANTALQAVPTNSVGTAQIADGTIALGDLATALQTAIGLAGTALQPATLATQVVTDSLRLLRPTMQKPTRFPAGSKQLTNFPSGHSWGLRSGSTGAVADDTTNYTEGSQSFSFTAASGTTTFVMSPVQSPTIDLLNNSLAIKFRIDQWARLGGMYLACTNDTGTTFATTRDQVSIASSASLLASDGEFVWVAVNPGDWSVAAGFSAVNLAAVARIGVYASGTGGTVQVNLQQLWTRPAPLTPCTVIWFDDGFGPQYTTAKPYLDKYGFRAVASPIRDLLGVAAGTYMSVTQVKDLYKSGWDIVGHADTAAAHGSTNALLDLSTTDGTASTFSSFETEIRNNKTWLLDNGFKDSADIFSWPQGKFDETRLAIARNYFTLIRTYRPTMVVSDADTYPFVDGSRLRQIAVQSGGTPTDPTVVNAALDAAWAAGHTPILTFHSLGSAQSYDYPVASFNTIIDHVAAAGYPVKTLSAIMRDNGIDTPVGKAALASKAPIPTGTPDGTKFYRDDGIWAVPPGVVGGGNVAAQLFTASGTYTAPATGLYRVSAVGGGGGGGAGGSALTSGGVATQVAGAGAGSGEFVESVVSLTAGDTLAVTIGTGGAGGTGGAANGNAGTGSAAGVNTTVVGTATLTARGGSAGGNGAANSISPPSPGFYGSGGTTTAPGHAGDGGSTSTASGFQGGPGIGLVAKGGGGGVPANATNGGFGSSGVFSSSHGGTSAGGSASSPTGAGAGGNGGGGGAPGGAGGNGSAGNTGLALIERIS